LIIGYGTETVVFPWAAVFKFVETANSRKRVPPHGNTRFLLLTDL